MKETVWVVCVIDGKWALREMENLGCRDRESQIVYIDRKYLRGRVFFNKWEAEDFYKGLVEEVEAFTERAVCACGKKPEVLLDTFLLMGEHPINFNASVVIRCGGCGEAVCRSWPVGYVGDVEKSMRDLMESALETWKIEVRGGRSNGYRRS